MAHTVDSRAGTAAAALRDLLDKAERQLPALDAAGLEAYLVHLDQVDALFGALLPEGIDLRSELARWGDLEDQIRRRAGSLVRMANRVGGLPSLRSRHEPAVNFWWRLDDLVAARRRGLLRRVLITLGVLGLLLVVGVFAYQTWLAPSPATLLQARTLNNTEQLVYDQKYDQALSGIDAALVSLPQDPELLVWAGVLAQKLGNSAQSAGYLQRARQVLGDANRYQLLLAMHQLAVGDLDGAENAAQSVLKANPQEAQAIFILASVAEARGQRLQAIQLFEKAAALAESTNPQLTVVSKVRLGVLLRQIDAPTETTVPGDATPP